MLASALPVALSSDGSIATAGRADLSRRQNQIDIREDIVDAVGVVLDAARMHHHARFCAAVHSRCLYDLFRRDSADLGRHIR